MAVHPGLGGRRRIGADEAGVAVRQVEGEEVRRLLDAADHHRRFAEVGLGVAGRVVQRHEHLPPAPPMLADVVLHDGVAAGEPVLVAQPLEHPLRGVALLGALAEIVPQPLVDDLGEPVQLRPPDRRGPPIPRRNREAQHLLHALARDPEMTRRRALAHPVPTGETNLPIQLHGENAPALPAAGKGQSGRLLRRPQRDHHAATVADFCTAVSKSTSSPTRSTAWGCSSAPSASSAPAPRSPGQPRLQSPPLCLPGNQSRSRMSADRHHKATVRHQATGRAVIRSAIAAAILIASRK